MITYKTPFQVTVSIERYTGPLGSDEGAVGGFGMEASV